MLLGEKPPASAVPAGLRPDALLSASHATSAPARGGSGIMAPVYPPPNAAAMRHMTELNPKPNANSGEELAER
jgi:hypothetical protein